MAYTSNSNQQDEGRDNQMWGAAISAIGSMAGGIMSNAANAKQASKNRDFQRDMSNTAHQREVADLRAAGLNPILSATGGSGASTPSGSVAQQEDVISPAINSALSYMKTKAEADRTNAEAMKTLAQKATEEKMPNYWEAQTSSAKSEARLKDEQAAHEARKIELTNTEKQYKQQLTDLVEKQKISEDLKQRLQNLDIDVMQAELEKAKTNKEIDQSTYGVILRYIERFTNALNLSGSAHRSFR